jgi:hypothetical protein
MEDKKLLSQNKKLDFFELRNDPISTVNKIVETPDILERYHLISVENDRQHMAEIM